MACHVTPQFPKTFTVKIEVERDSPPQNENCHPIYIYCFCGTKKEFSCMISMFFVPYNEVN